MARITFKDVKTNLGITETYDIINAIRNSSSPQFQAYVPLASAENVAQVGAGILMNSALQNEFITSLVERIGLVIINSVQLNNPLKKFKKGRMPQGRTIEEIFVDIAEGFKYDPEDAEKTVFKREIPNVKTLFHEMNRQDFYKKTIQDESLKTAFVSWGNFEGFTAGIINSIYNSAEVDEYKYMKLLIDNYYSKGLFSVVPVLKPVDGTSSQEFVKKARATARKMTLPMGSREWNSLAVHTKSDMNDLHLFIDADLEAELDVDVLAKAFNMDRTTFLGNTTVIDGFASDGVVAVLVDKDFFMVYDKLLKMETMRNSQGLYWNYFYHHWQVLSASRFANAVAFVDNTKTKPVTAVIVDPVQASIKQGRTMEFTAYVRATDGQKHDVTWSVEGDAGTTISGTTIDSDGVLTVGASQTGQLKVIATVTYDTDQEVIGEAIVNVQPSS